MLPYLLPASAKPLEPRSAPKVVLSTKVEPWLTKVLRDIKRRLKDHKGPLVSASRCSAYLAKMIGGENAIWTLASLSLPKVPDSESSKNSDALVETLSSCQTIHIEAYVVHVDMVWQHEVAYKLTSETIDAMSEYHKDIYLVNVAARIHSWPGKDVQLKKMQEQFEQAANRFVFRTGVRALRALEDDGSGELRGGPTKQVKTSLMDLFLPLLVPVPCVVDVEHPVQILPKTTAIITGHQDQSDSQGLSASALPACGVSPQLHLPTYPITYTTCSEHLSSGPWHDFNTPAKQLSAPTLFLSQQSPSGLDMYSTPDSVTLPIDTQLLGHRHTNFDPRYSDFSWDTSMLQAQGVTMIR